MKGKTIAKLGAGLVVLVILYLGYKWLSGLVAAAQYTPGDNGLYSPSWAAPIAYPGPVTGWYQPWQRQWRPRGRRY